MEEERLRKLEEERQKNSRRSVSSERGGRKLGKRQSDKQPLRRSEAAGRTRGTVAAERTQAEERRRKAEAAAAKAAAGKKVEA